MDTKRELARSGVTRLTPGIAVILLGFTVLLSACTALRPIADDAGTLQEQLRAGQAVQPGDRVRVLTHDGRSHRLIVASVEDDMLKGRPDTKPPSPTRTGQADDQKPERDEVPLVEIPLGDIVLVDKQEISAGRTVLAIGSGTLVFLSALLLIALAAL